MIVEALKYENVLAIAKDMREADAREIYATRWTDDPADLAADCMRVPDFAWTFHSGGKPICAMGAHPSHSGVWTAWMFATNDFRRLSTYVTKFVLRVMLPSLVRVDFHRMHCLSMEGHDEAHKWLSFLGAKCEATLRAYGRNKENFYFFAWSKEDVLRRIVRK